MNIGIVSLGCTKNLVDSEMILGAFKSQGFNIVNEVEEADIIIVNTCGFIQSAKEEAINTILDMADYKEEGRCKALIVTGCLAKRYKQEIIESMPEVDLVVGVDEYDKLPQILSEFFNQKKLFNQCKFTQKLDYLNRMVSSTYPLAYIRISDGCDNKCSYCAIPLIRGGFVSRQMEDILKEAE